MAEYDLCGHIAKYFENFKYLYARESPSLVGRSTIQPKVGCIQTQKVTSEFKILMETPLSKDFSLNILFPLFKFDSETNLQSANRFFQDIIFFVINYLLSLPEHAKKIFLYLLHANDDHANMETVYPPLKFIQISTQFITHFDQNLPSEPCDNHDQVDEPYETKVDISPLVLDPTPSKTHHR
jgi:hypothetical protein